MAKKEKKDVSAARAVVADQRGTSGAPAQLGELVSIYTSTRAWRGIFLGQTEEMFLLHAPTIVWTADEQNVNHNKSKYFTKGRPTGRTEEPSGARLVAVTIAGTVYAHAHEVMEDLPVTPDIVTPDGLPRVGQFVHVSTVTHELRGVVATVGDDYIQLVDAEMVNDIPTGSFADVLAEKRQGDDHVQLVGRTTIMLHMCTALTIR